ncbi:glycosyltransferase family 4 protein [Schizophyllum commune]
MSSESMPPINIAMVGDFFHPNVGGVENHIYMLGAQLLARGHKVIVITHSHRSRSGAGGDGDRVGIRWLLPGLKVYHIPFPPIANSATLPNFFTFLPYFRTIVLREHIQLVHAHASLSSLGHEALLHAHLLGVRTVFSDHSLFGFEDAASILTNKLLVGTLKNVDAVICVSHTGRENTVLRGQLFEPREDDPTALTVRNDVYVIPNALVADHFVPDPPTSTDISGTGPKLIDLLQMREKHRLQDRIELLGPVAHGDVLSHLRRGHIFLNTSLTEAFGIAILEAACAGLYVVSTRVGGVPEILPEDMICFAEPEEDDVVRAIARAVRHIQAGAHDPLRAHARVRTFYDWAAVTGRTEHVYRAVMAAPGRDLMERMRRNLSLGPWFGMIQVIILVVDCLFFLVLEWLIPREDIDYVTCTWDARKAREALREAEGEAQEGRGGEAKGGQVEDGERTEEGGDKET